MENIHRPTIKLPVQCGRVRKAAIREALNATAYEFERTTKMLCERDAEFAVAYADFKTSWSMPEALAVRFVLHVSPGYRLEMVVEG